MYSLSYHSYLYLYSPSAASISCYLFSISASLMHSESIQLKAIRHDLHLIIEIIIPTFECPFIPFEKQYMLQQSF